MAPGWRRAGPHGDGSAPHNHGLWTCQSVDEIRAVLHWGDPARNGRLAGLASAYAEACIEVTQRLGRCHRLLQQGLRSEAIQLAETEPKLLSGVAALDFPERSDGDDLVRI